MVGASLASQIQNGLNDACDILSALLINSLTFNSGFPVLGIL